MTTFVSNLKALASDERGLTALDYGLTAGIVAVAVIGSMTALGAKISQAVATVINALP